MNTQAQPATPWCTTPPPGMSTQEPTRRPREHGLSVAGELSERRLVRRWVARGSDLVYVGVVSAPLLSRPKGTLPPSARHPHANTHDAAPEPVQAREQVASLGGAQR